MLKKFLFIDFDKVQKEAEEKLKDTFLEKYTTFYFDLDGVIFDAYTPDGSKIYTFETNPPFELLEENIIIDLNNNIIKLQIGIRNILELLDYTNKNLGIISHSADKEKMLPFSAQPSVMLLKKFNIYDYFNFPIIVKPDINKLQYAKPVGNTLFIDDEFYDVEITKKYNIDFLWRKSFVNWNDLLLKTNYY